MSGDRCAVTSRRISKEAMDHIDFPLAILNVMRRKCADELRALIPDGRVHFVFSKVAHHQYDLTALASENDEAALVIATKLRTSRRRWRGYRTDMEWMEDQP